MFTLLDAPSSAVSSAVCGGLGAYLQVTTALCVCGPAVCVIQLCVWYSSLYGLAVCVVLLCVWSSSVCVACGLGVCLRVSPALCVVQPCVVGGPAVCVMVCGPAVCGLALCVVQLCV